MKKIITKFILINSFLFSIFIMISFVFKTNTYAKDMIEEPSVSMLSENETTSLLYLDTDWASQVKTLDSNAFSAFSGYVSFVNVVPQARSTSANMHTSGI